MHDAAYPVVDVARPDAFHATARRWSRLMRHMLVYDNPQGYSTFPDIEMLQGGELVITFREACRRRFATHIDSTAKAVMIRSTDLGRTWSEKVVVWNEPGVSLQDPSICQLTNGNLLVNYFTWGVGTESQAPQRVGRLRDLDGEHVAWGIGTFVVRSFDQGRTWTEPPIQVAPPESERGVAIATSDAVLELSTRDLLIPLEVGYPNELERAAVMRSVDGGQTWDDVQTIAHDPLGQLGFYEPSLLQTPTGKVICLMRTHVRGIETSEAASYLYQSDSADGGRTWSVPTKTPVWGHPAHLCALSNGKILCVYGYRRPPYGIRACVSEDDGETWRIDDEIIIRSDGKSDDLGYPTAVELPDGEVLVVYYMHPLDENWRDGHAVISGSILNIT
jgi:Neuraminidase (sialidase)